MKNENYRITQYSVNGILADVEGNKIAVPELQRPFVWKDKQVRDLMDSLYRGYPIGYLIVWQNSTVKVRFGKQAAGKKILIDGQQRITALMAAILGREVLDDAYHVRKIQIAFNPFPEAGEEQFAVWEEKLSEDKRWIQDISEIFKRGFSYRRFENEYVKENPRVNTRELDAKITQLKNIATNDVGVIELSFLLDIDIVTEIFIRINTQGKPLTQEDFAMSKISVFENNEGDDLRKTIDYFCHLCYEPSFIKVLEDGEKQFLDSECGKQILWTGKVSQQFFVPSYGDLLKTVCLCQFGKGKIGDLVQILSGKDAKSNTVNMDKAKEGFSKLREGVFSYVKKENFLSFIEAIKETGFITEKMLPSHSILNYLYAFYLKVIEVSDMNLEERKSFMRRWFIMSIITGRYQGTTETAIIKDIQSVEEKNPKDVLEGIEKKSLSDSFFQSTLKDKLKLTGTRSVFYSIYLATLIRTNTKALYSKEILVKDLLEEKVDKTLLFTKAYLQKHNAKGDATELANTVFIDKDVKTALKRKAPNEYGEILLEYCERGTAIGKEIVTREELLESMKENCIPKTIFTMDTTQFPLFLEVRRKMMAEKIRDYYRGL
ncbi:MAG: DUF262 domain-containing protein [Lachnospiraceae bacterium]